MALKILPAHCTEQDTLGGLTSSGQPHALPKAGPGLAAQDPWRGCLAVSPAGRSGAILKLTQGRKGPSWTGGWGGQMLPVSRPEKQQGSVGNPRGARVG